MQMEWSARREGEVEVDEVTDVKQGQIYRALQYTIKTSLAFPLTYIQGITEVSSIFNKFSIMNNTLEKNTKSQDCTSQ